MLSELQWGTAALTQALLGRLGTALQLQGDVLSHAGGFAAQVDLACTALIPALLLLAALALWGWLDRPAPQRLALAMLLGLTTMALVNQLRLLAVIWVGVHAPAHFPWVHEVLGPLLLVVAGAAWVAVCVGRAGGNGAGRAHDLPAPG